MLIEIHLIQSFSPSNLNRDDTGNPKDTLFGGERRVRISSQAQKRPIRLSAHFQETIATGSGIRSKTLVARLSERLTLQGLSPELAVNWSQSFVANLAKLDAKKNNSSTSVLLYLSLEEEALICDTLFQMASEIGQPNAKMVEKAFREFSKSVIGRTSAPDIAMFGRMLADAPGLNIDAACQVAHAISTHQATTEFDYFTAVDDLQSDDTPGAGMIGLTPFTSATFYRYARIDWVQLVRNLGNDTKLAQRTVEGFLRALVFALPTGKQNSFASHLTPNFMLAIVRPDQQGWSLANAFERPVRACNGSGYVTPSVKALLQQWRKQEDMFRLKLPSVVAILNASEASLDEITINEAELDITTLASNLPQWIEAILRTIPIGD